MADIEDRVRSLENKIWIATGAAIVFAAWFGIANLYYIPTSVQAAVDKTSSGETAKDVEKLAEKAKSDADKIAKLTQNGTITISGICFKPMYFIRCNHLGEHMTTIYEDKVKGAKDCTDASYSVEQNIPVLAKCP